MERDGVLTRDVKEGYVMKNDPLRKQVLVSPVIVPIEEKKLFEDQLDGNDLIMKPKLAKVLSGGPAEPYLTKPEGRVELVSIPIKNGVDVKGDIVNEVGTEFSRRVFGNFHRRV